MKVKVHYLFSKNHKIGSKFICWGTKHLVKQEECSHIAILVNNRWVFESTLETGVRIVSYSKWKEINIEIDKIPCIQTHREYSEVKKIFKDIQNKKYDWPGILYLGFYIFLNKYFKINIPKINKWQNNDKYFCCEAVEKLTGINSTEMRVPIQILEEFKNG